MDALEKFERILDVEEIARKNFSEKNLKAAPSNEEMFRLLDILTNAMLAHVKALKKRVAELEARPVLRYVGTWDRVRNYEPGEICTDGGSAWICQQETNSRPGTTDRWQLMVKRGRDGDKPDGAKR